MRGSIRRMEASDAAAAAALAGELGYGSASPALVAERLAAVTPRDDHAVWVCEEAPGELLGLIHAQHMDRIVSDPYAEILHLVVSRRARRGGVGRALVARVQEWAAARGLDRVRVRSNVVRGEAHDFYLALGFDRHKTQHVYVSRVAAD